MHLAHYAPTLNTRRAPAITRGCTFCGACATECEAYSMTPGHLIWRAAFCTDCGRCTALCPAGAIARGEGEVITLETRDRPRVLAEAAERTCTCGEPFYNSDTDARCPRCEQDSHGTRAAGGRPDYF
ncbi:MAG: 4Fe-4S dicluster domain [Symbiobacteriaceae bacterium]|jgi:MinD superfamily P-loop ATPase|nr:4Fe-4S dicluster domain [Symbiobacteriaceae bacterium]